MWFINLLGAPSFCQVFIIFIICGIITCTILCVGNMILSFWSWRNGLHDLVKHTFFFLIFFIYLLYICETHFDNKNNADSKRVLHHHLQFYDFISYINSRIYLHNNPFKITLNHIYDTSSTCIFLYALNAVFSVILTLILSNYHRPFSCPDFPICLCRSITPFMAILISNFMRNYEAVVQNLIHTHSQDLRASLVSTWYDGWGFFFFLSERESMDEKLIRVYRISQKKKHIITIFESTVKVIRSNIGR